MPPPIEGEDIVTIAVGPQIAGTSRGSQKRYVSELKTHDGSPHVPEPRAPMSLKVDSQPITFTKKDASDVPFPHNEPLVITAEIANRRVHRALIVNGSSVNVLYKETIKKIGLTMRDLQACATIMYGFCGEGIVSMGAIDLAVTLGEYPMSVTKIVEFVVVDTPSAYNVILGRPIIDRGSVICKLLIS